MRLNIVQLTADRLLNPLLLAHILTDLMEVPQAQQDILSAPQVPALELLRGTVCRNSPCFILTVQQRIHRVRQQLIQRRIPRIFPRHARAAHELAPVFAAPAQIGIIHWRGELLRRQLPQLRVFQLFVLHEANHCICPSGICKEHFYTCISFSFFVRRTAAF